MGQAELTDGCERGTQAADTVLIGVAFCTALTACST